MSNVTVTTRFALRLALTADLPALRLVMDAAIGALQAEFLSAEQVTASRAVMGLDTQLVTDGTYWLVESRARIAGCGGWSGRATLYGGDHSGDLREPRVLDPMSEPARIRAMYTHPDFARQGVAALLLARCEAEAAANGFAHAELMATLAGEPLYARAGYREIERIVNNTGGAPVPLIRMGKPLSRSPRTCP